MTEPHAFPEPSPGAAVETRIHVIAEFKSTRALPPGAARLVEMAGDFLAFTTAEAGTAAFGGHPLYHPERAATTKGAPHGRQPVWEWVPEGGLAFSDDFHPAVFKVLGDEAAADKRRVPALRLGTIGLNLLNGAYLAPPSPESAPGAPKPSARGYRLDLSKGAQRRLGRPPATEGTETPGIKIELLGATVLLPSNFGIIVFELAIRDGAISADLVQEALHLLTNRNRRDACGLAGPDEATVKISIADLMGAVCPKRHCAFESWNRLYTYTAVTLPRFETDSGAARRLAFKLARHYTADYQPGEDQIAAAIYQPFVPVIHAFSLEGAATVVDGGTDFMAEQFGARIRQSYLPLAILAYHEHAYLIDMTHDDRQKTSSAVIGRFLDYRRRYRLPLVSDLEMHNAAYDRLRHSLHNDLLIEKLARDSTESYQFQAAEAEKLRVAALRRRKKQRYQTLQKRKKTARQVGGLQALLMGGLMFLAFSNIVERGASLISEETIPSTAIRFWALAIGLLAGLGAGGLQYRRIIDEADRDLAEIETEGDGVEDQAIDEGSSADPTQPGIVHAAPAVAGGHSP
jgi:hypothetical protein